MGVLTAPVLAGVRVVPEIVQVNLPLGTLQAVVPGERRRGTERGVVGGGEAREGAVSRLAGGLGRRVDGRVDGRVCGRAE